MSILRNRQNELALIIPRGKASEEGMFTLTLHKLISKIGFDFLTSSMILSAVDKVKEVRDLIILAASVVFLNAILVAIWALIKMCLRLIRHKILTKAEQSKDEKTKKILKDTADELNKHVDKTDKIIEKITTDNIKTPKK